MKYQHLTIFAVFLLICLAVMELEALDIVKDGKPELKIYLEKSSQNQAKASKKRGRNEISIVDSAVKDFIYHIRKMSGAELEVKYVSSPSEIKFPAIVVGKIAEKLGVELEKTDSETGSESFRIIVGDDRILIRGGSYKGSSYGIYELLRKLGCDWIMPGTLGEVVPAKKTVTISKIDETQSPDFIVRRPWYTGGSRMNSRKEDNDFEVWKRRQKQSYDRSNDLMMIGGHVWGGLIKRNRKKFADNPDLLALVRMHDGTLKRKGPQIETTNPEILDIFVDYIRGIYKKKGWSKDKTACIGIGPADGLGYSVSPEALAAGSGRIDPVIGEPDRTDELILLANKILAKIGKEYPNLYLGFYLYSVHGDYPMRYKPDPRIIIVLADISYSRFHSIIDKNSKSRIYYHNILKEWEKLSRQQGNKIWFRGYNWNLAENMLPYSKLKIWGEDIPYYKKMGVLGTYVEVAKGWAVTGPSDYLLARLNWNTKEDWKKVLKEYCLKAFGKGGPFMEKYYLELTRRQHAAGREAGSYHSFALMYDQNFVEDSKELFDKAYAIAETPIQKKRVQGFRQPLESLETFLKFRKALEKCDYSKGEEYYKIMLDIYNKYYKMDSNLIGKHVERYLKRFVKRMVEAGKKYSSGEYKIVYKIPDQLKTIFDPYLKGQEMGFQNIEINDSDFILTKTFSSTWDAQGLASYRDGAVWYRLSFPVSKALSGKPVGLFIGGVDDEVRVWINGKYIGQGRGFSLPFAFDLTDSIKYGADNTLALQVTRHSKINELGTGGIIYPGFIFTGPRLKIKAPKLEPMKRVLPGGALDNAKN